MHPETELFGFLLKDVFKAVACIYPLPFDPPMLRSSRDTTFEIDVIAKIIQAQFSGLVGTKFELKCIETVECSQINGRVKILLSDIWMERITAQNSTIELIRRS